ncbi:MAG: cytochrome-c peroxidase [Bacteroidia bacterium]
MRKVPLIVLGVIISSFVFLSSCKEETNTDPSEKSYPGIESFLNIDVNALANYSNQDIPNYYQNLNTNTPIGNQITNMGATLGRVLFYDKALSIDNSVSCASCHDQSLGFTDTAVLSTGFDGGKTGAHSMRLANAAFYEGIDFFWDRRAPSLEAQSTMPIQDPVEMGFDASNGGIEALIQKMNALAYYPELFELAFGSTTITEERMQDAMAQFMRSMISYNSKFDEGFALAYNPNAPGPGMGVGRDFNNYSAQENLGKTLFLQPPNNGGGGCAGCHVPPSFSLVAVSRSNGLDGGETTIFKSPSLKNIGLGGPFMHDGSLETLEDVVEHYNSGIQDGPALDPRLKPGGVVQQLNLTSDEKAALVAFLETLTDQEINQDPKFSTPFKS